MKLKPSTLLLYFCFYFNTAHAQLYKGDYLLDGFFDGSYYLNDANKVHYGWLEVEASAGLGFKEMITKRLMVGASLAASEIRAKSDRIPRSIWQEYNQAYHRSASVDFRWYFATKRWAPFVFLQTTYSSQKYVNSFTFVFSEQNIKEYGIYREVGFGLSCLIGKNIMLESIIGHNRRLKGGLFTPYKFSLKTNFNVFFGDREPVTLLRLKEQLLKTGSILLAGNLQWRSGADEELQTFNFNQSSMDEELPTFSFNQATTFFVGKRTALNGQLTYSKFKNDDKAISSAIGIHQYFDLTKSLLFSAQLQMRTSKYVIPGAENPDNFTEFPVSVNLHYFHKRQRFIVGTEYAWQRRVDDSQNIKKFKSQQLNAYLGMDYYLARNVLLHQQLTLNWQTEEVPADFELFKLYTGQKKLDYSFALVFLL